MVGDQARQVQPLHGGLVEETVPAYDDMNAVVRQASSYLLFREWSHVSGIYPHSHCLACLHGSCEIVPVERSAYAGACRMRTPKRLSRSLCSGIERGRGRTIGAHASQCTP